MTEEELKQAAIELCKIRGINPYETLPHDPLSEELFMLCRSKWEEMVVEIKTHNEIQTAIRRADTKAVVGYEEFFSKFVSDAREKAEND